MTGITIENLRHRAWVLVNASIDTINKLNDVIYENSLNKPAKIENKPEELTNISLQYIQSEIDIFNSFISEINKKKNYLVSIQNKHIECLDVLKKIME